MWLLTRHDDVRFALTDPRLSQDWRWTLREEQRATAPSDPIPMMILMDPPDHTRLRALVSRSFTARRMAELQPRVQQIADDLAQLPETGTVDLTQDYAFQLPDRPGRRASAARECRIDGRVTLPVKRLMHFDVGPVMLGMQSFDVRVAPGQELVVYHAESWSPSTQALALLGWLAGWLPHLPDTETQHVLTAGPAAARRPSAPTYEETAMTRLLFVATSVPGHVIPLRLAAAEMVRRGHDVTFVTSPQFGPQVQATGARFVPTYGPAAFEVMELAAQRNHLPPGPEQLNWEWQRAFVDAVPVQHELIQRELDAAGDEPVVLLTDSTCFAGWPSRLGAPGRRPAASIILGITILSVTSQDTGPGALGVLPDSSEEGRARNAALNAQFEGLLASTQSHLQRMLQDLGASEPPPFIAHGMSTMADRTLQLCPASFEYPRSDLPVGIRFIGPLPQPFEGDFELPDWWDDVLAAERVVVVTQGTVANTDHSALFQPALTALADLDALIVVTSGVEGTVIEGVPSNARIGGFIPFDLLLPHADVLVTNAGYGGVLKALTHGVPMVVAGDTEDKPAVAAHVDWSGTGIDLRTGHPSAQAVGDAVRQVLSDPSYAQAAAATRAEIADHHPFDAIEATTDELLTPQRERLSATAR